MTQSPVSNPDNAGINRLRLAAIGGFLLTVVVIALGAWTRLVDAGLGCPDWPGCYGFLTVPSGADNVALAEARFPETPVDASKGWPEMIHRYAAGLLGLVIFGIAIASWRLREQGAPVRLSLFTAGFVVLQAAFGAWTVTLALWPQVVAAHLLGGFTTLCLLFVLAMKLSQHRLKLGGLGSAARHKLGRLRPWLYAGVALVVLQIALGAWTAANYAAVACPDFPTCQGQWWPEMEWQEGFNVFQTIGPNYLGGQLGNEARVAIHKAHRVGAIAVTGFLTVLLVMMARRARGSDLLPWVILSGVLLAVQVLLGVVNVLLHIPVAIAVAHNAFGAFLLVALINLAFRLRLLESRGTEFSHSR